MKSREAERGAGRSHGGEKGGKSISDHIGKGKVIK
jgi:hypothetical protein